MFPQNLPGEEFINSFYPILIALLLGLIIGFRNYMRGPKCPTKEGAKGKVAIVTGANQGIGKETAQELANRECRVIVACRDEAKGKEAVKSITTITKSKNVIFMKLDLNSFTSIKAFVEKFNKKEDRLDYLINNAGIMSQPYNKTEDGNESHFQTNYLGHFLLTHMLLDKLKASAPSRIVNFIAPAYSLVEEGYFQNPNFEELPPEAYTAMRSYSGSKMAVMLFTKTLARKLEGSDVTCNAVLPGIVNTQIYKEMPFNKSILVKLSVGPILWYLMKSAYDGAQLPVYLCLAKEEEGVSGKLFKDFTIIEPDEKANNREIEKELYKLSLKLTDLQDIYAEYKEEEEVEEQQAAREETEKEQDVEQNNEKGS